MDIVAAGYFSLIQYCPDFGRMEFANVGVILLVEEPHYIGFRLDDENLRAKRFFGPVVDDNVNSAKQALQFMLKDVTTVAMLASKISSLANYLSVYPPRWIRIDKDPESTLSQVYNDLVADYPPAWYSHG